MNPVAPASSAPAAERAAAFCSRWGLQSPIVLAPMAGACPPALSAAVMRAGAMGACGALLMAPQAIADWAVAVRGDTGTAPFQINLWVPDPAPRRDAAHEAAVAGFLGRFGPPVPPGAGDARPPDFDAQCQALLAARPAVASSIMGLFAPAFVQQLKAQGIAWWATVTTVAEARAAEVAGADVLVAQGMEAGGHRGRFDAGRAEAEQVGLMALLPALADAVALPLVAAGGIADARGVAAAFALGASAVQVGTGFLRTPEAALHPAWADALGRTAPEDTRITRAFSGRPGRGIATGYVLAAAAGDAPAPAPYPVQRALTATMRQQALADGNLQHMQAWAGQSAALAAALPAAQVVALLAAGVPR